MAEVGFFWSTFRISAVFFIALQTWCGASPQTLEQKGSGCRSSQSGCCSAGNISVPLHAGPTSSVSSSVAQHVPGLKNSQVLVLIQDTDGSDLQAADGPGSYGVL
ncbi:hypothetical protein ILYODFUR_028495 [Ilyodon furcidens]|uniref:Uncharacterized protein n=1 Tax=Ilyodon furcidens TaxID=33524 RepID=A0ABV0U988_9TELE